MDTILHLPSTLDSLGSALSNFHDNYLLLKAFLLMTYALDVSMYFITLCASLHDLVASLWLHSIHHKWHPGVSIAAPLPLSFESAFDCWS